MAIKKTNERVFIEGKMLTANNPIRVIVFTPKIWKLMVIRDSRWLNSKPVTVHLSGKEFMNQVHFYIFFTEVSKTKQALPTVTNSAVNAVFPILPILELPNLYFPNT